MRRFRSFAVALAVALVVAGSTQADVFEFNFNLEGSQEVPPNDSNAAGLVTLFQYDTATQTFDLETFIVGIGIDDLLGVGPGQRKGASGTHRKTEEPVLTGRPPPPTSRLLMLRENNPAHG